MVCVPSCINGILGQFVPGYTVRHTLDNNVVVTHYRFHDKKWLNLDYFQDKNMSLRKGIRWCGFAKGGI